VTGAPAARGELDDSADRAEWIPVDRLDAVGLVELAARSRATAGR
jgi:hypothetical protein